MLLARLMMVSVLILSALLIDMADMPAVLPVIVCAVPFRVSMLMVSVLRMTVLRYLVMVLMVFVLGICDDVILTTLCGALASSMLHVGVCVVSISVVVAVVRTVCCCYAMCCC